MAASCITLTVNTYFAGFFSAIKAKCASCSFDVLAAVWDMNFDSDVPTPLMCSEVRVAKTTTTLIEADQTVKAA